MRTIYLLPLTGLLGAVIACGPTGVEQVTRSVPKRDLTLVTPPRAVEIASRVETGMIQTENRTHRRSGIGARLPKSRQPISAPKPKLTDQWVPRLVIASPRPPVQEAPSAATPVTNDRELPPGKTVTLIPASSGPTTDTGGADEGAGTSGRARAGGHRGGRCGGRGRGPAATPSPRPDFR
jgi:hypothetical protein